MGMDNNIFTQIGLVVLIGAGRQERDPDCRIRQAAAERGKSRYDATVDACRLRLRPILMTSFAFILGVVPLVLPQEPGPRCAWPWASAVFSGMLGVTLFGIFFTPVFYSTMMWFAERRAPKPQPPAATH